MVWFGVEKLTVITTGRGKGYDGAATERKLFPARVFTGLLMRMSIAATLASASPDCSNAGPKPPSERAAKMDYCRHTSIALVLAFRSRLDGKTEHATFSTLGANTTNEIWYVKNRDTVKDIVHQIYAKEPTYQKLKARIAPNAASMARAISAITEGCEANTKVAVESR